LNIPGYMIHYFSADKNPVVVFDSPTQPGLKLDYGVADFRLDGCGIPDDDERMGPLFVGEPPTICGNPRDMRRVTTMVVGREGGGIGRWRKQFDRGTGREDAWSIPHDIRAQGAGWYFVRLYGTDYKLIDSLDFRYVPSLRKIEIT